MSKPLRILRLEADNVKRLRAVQITPSGELVVVGGRNAQGKSSVLDAIEMALGGQGAVPKQPVRRGENGARVVIDLGDLVVRRVFKADGSSTLHVESKEGVRQKQPQQMLDELVGRLSFDPLEFSRVDARKQYDLLCALVQLDLQGFESKRATVFEERTGVNRRHKQLEGQLAGLPPRHTDAPAEEVSIDAIAEELRTARALEKNAIAAEAELEQARGKLVEAEKRLSTIRERASELEQSIAQMQRDLAGQREREAGLQQLIETKGKALVDNAAAAATEARARVPDMDAIHARLHDVGSVNKRVEQNKQRAGLEDLVRDTRRSAEELTARLEQLDAERREAIEAAKFPVPGLSVADGAVTFNGLPFEQASQAEKLRASVAIGLAMNPKLRVLLIRDGSLLDQEGVKLLAELAAAADAQVWLERVSETGAGCSVVIEDGAVKGAEKPASDAEVASAG